MDVKQMRNNHVQFVDLDNPVLGDDQNNPIYVENFIIGLRGRLHNPQEGDRKNPIDVDVFQLNHPIPLDEPDGDNAFYQIAVKNSLSAPAVAEVINLDDYDPKGKKPMQAIRPYANFGESSYSRRKFQMIDCSICFEEVPKREMFHMIGCTHSYCTTCVRRHVTTKLNEGVVNIGCLGLGCKDGLLLPHMCRKILPAEVYSRWGDKLCEGLFPENTKFYCPFKDCSALLINDGEAITKSECPHCNRLFCAQCKVAWHIGFKCEDYQKLGQDERQTEDLLLMNVAKANKWSRCPKCHFFVERSEGCMLISCRCGYLFCYGCGTKMDRYRHYCELCRR